MNVPRGQVAAALSLGVVFLSSLLFHRRADLLILVAYFSGLALALGVVFTETRADDPPPSHPPPR